jgi:dihydrodipicolinate synthase/N-acetylneuraminate lyase
MKRMFEGVMQSTVTPLKDDFTPDVATFEKLLDFHVRTGATAISWPHHKGESLNLTMKQRKELAEVAVKALGRRIPISIHVSALSVEDSLELAHHAQEIGADAIIAITPYFWNPSPEALYDHYVRLGTAVDLPMIAYNSPRMLSGAEITGELLGRLLERLPNLIALKDASFHSEKFLELSRTALAIRPDFSLVTGVEFLSPSVPLGGVGCYSSAGAICPNLCTELYAACTSGDAARARELQFRMLRLWDLLKEHYPSSLKGGMVIMGRPVGPTSPPLPTASKERIAFIASRLEELGIIASEPHGW